MVQKNNVMITNKASFFKFCPNCSSQEVTFVNNFKFYCKSCHFVLYHNIAAAVAIVFTYQNQILFTVRNVDPDKGKLDLPGGFIDPNENAEEAACREIQEELGLLIKSNDLKYVTTAPNDYLYKTVPYRTMDIIFECPLASQEISINAQNEIKELLWIERTEIDLNAIGFASIRKVIGERYRK